MPLSELQTLVNHVIIMRMRETEALAYLKNNGYEISRVTLWRIKKALEENKFKRLYDIAKIGFVDQHLERIAQLELIQSELWKLYYEEKQPLKRAVILEKIYYVQPYLSAYYEASREILEHTNDPKLINGILQKLDNNNNNNSSNNNHND